MSYAALALQLIAAARAKPAPVRIEKQALPNSIVGQPLYVALKVMPGSAAALANWAKDAGIPNPVAAADLHITTVYSRTPVPLYQLPDPGYAPTEQLDPAEYRLGFLDEGNVLVMFVRSCLACASHDHAANKGASWDYPTYEPHITLSYDASGFTTLPEPPPFAIEVGDEYARRIDSSSDN